MILIYAKKPRTANRVDVVTARLPRTSQLKKYQATAQSHQYEFRRFRGPSGEEEEVLH
jgi:hypothetical protein